MKKSELEKMLRGQLSRHDWNYRNATIPAFYNNGEKEWQNIRNTKLQLAAAGMPLKEITKIHNEYASKDRQMK